MHRKLFFILFHVFAIALLPAQNEVAPLKKLEAYIHRAQQQWEVPGLAVAVVKDGEVLMTKGYGVRSLTSNEAVTEKTLFAMASTTKAMTAAAIGMLVDEGKLDWDDPVVQYMPEFQLADAYITRDLRVRDLLTHSAGIGNADFLWWKTKLSSKEILERMRHASITYPLRGGYTYQNIMYLAAGMLVEKRSGMPWAEFIRTRIMEPLGMRNSFPLKQLAFQKENRSTPHDRFGGKIQPMVDTDADAIGPAGSGWSCAEDMAKWMNFLLDSARIGEKRLLQPDTYSELFQPQIVIPKEQFYPTARLTDPFWTTYALGWFQHDYRGKAVSFHTGSLGGTVAICGLLPEERIGVYVFGNLDHAEVRHAIMYKTFDLLTGQEEQRDWSTDFKKLYDDIHAKNEQQRQDAEASRKTNTTPSLPLRAYTGTYQDPLYGSVDIRLKEGKLVVDLTGKLQVTLDHWHYDTFQGHYNLPWLEPDLFSFELSEAGEAAVFKQGKRSWKKLSE